VDKGDKGDKGFWRLTVADHFSSAHQLRHFQGKCEQMHGHNFQVELCVEGRRLHQDTGIVLDFKELKTLLKEVLAELDHCNLNEAPAFRQTNPSSENLARFVFQRVKARLAAPEVRVYSVSVAEGPTSIAAYFEEE
jgi:6-pyruvoyltetrahydropterin/6-carboxytetrahydropterin synthase